MRRSCLLATIAFRLAVPLDNGDIALPTPTIVVSFDVKVATVSATLPTPESRLGAHL
jgi:hypothetical protein